MKTTVIAAMMALMTSHLAFAANATIPSASNKAFSPKKGGFWSNYNQSSLETFNCSPYGVMTIPQLYEQGWRVVATTQGSIQPTGRYTYFLVIEEQ
ncbi:MAG: hypothetical protein IPG66_06310 [Hydrogenophilales bacterium]|nr:hypothetical protein [Hydrogenophilales bacterium]